MKTLLLFRTRRAEYQSSRNSTDVGSSLFSFICVSMFTLSCILVPGVLSAQSTETKDLWGMGYNGYGRLGDGTTTDRASPVWIAESVAGVAAGRSHSLFIKDDGSLWGMGHNGTGQLGDGTTTDRVSPIRITESVVAVAAGTSHSLFIKDDGSLWGMGNNATGQLGDGTTTDRASPVLIAESVTAVAAGRHSLFIKDDGSLWAMGRNRFGQLGDGTTTDRDSPVQIAESVAAVAAGSGYGHSLFIKDDGSLWAMGYNRYGQLGDGTTTHRASPVRIAESIAAVAAGGGHSLFIKDDGSLWGMGYNGTGQLGDGTTTDRASPVGITESVAAVAAGRNHSLFIKDEGSLWAMGHNSSGQLGEGRSWGERVSPVHIAESVAAVAAGDRHSLFGGKKTQTLTFWELPEKTYGDPPVNIAAEASSGLPVSLEVISGPGLLNGNELTITGAGTVSLEASQEGNDQYKAAPTVTRSFEVAKASASPQLQGMTVFFDGSPKTPTVQTTPAEIPVNLTFNGSSTPPTELGTYRVTATVDDPNYEGEISGDFRIEFNNTGGPSDLTLGTTWFYDDISTNTPIGNLSATDPDDLDTLSFELVSGTGDTDNNKFTIEEGALYINTTFEGYGTYSIRVRVTDLGGASIEDVLTIQVVDARPSARFDLKAAFTSPPSYVNTIFQLKDAQDGGINLPRELFEQDTDIFKVFEDDSAISPTESFLQVAKMDEVPATIKTVILLDNSASVGSDILEIREAAARLVEQRLPQQEIALYSFSGSMTQLHGFTRDEDSLKEAIGDLTLGEATTNLYGSIFDALDLWTESFSLDGIETGFVVVLTDGSDTTGSVNRSAVITKRDDEAKRIFTVGLGNEADGTSLEILGNAGFQPVESVEELDAAFTGIQQSIEADANSFYWINYASPKRGDVLRNLRVELNGNISRDNDARLSAEFNSRGFSEIERGVTINRTVYDADGVTGSLAMFPEDATPVHAITMLPLASETPQYEWTVGDPALVTVTSEASDGSQILLVPTGEEGTTTLTLTDTTNTTVGNDIGLDADAFTRTVNLVIGTGLGSNPAWPTALDAGDGWMESEWFGWFNEETLPLIYHLEHSWLYYGSGDESSGIYFYDRSLKSWLWIQQKRYPYLYKYPPNGSWIYFLSGTGGDGQRWFYHYNLNEWFIETEL